MVKLLWTVVFLTMAYRTHRAWREFSCFHPAVVAFEPDQVELVEHGWEWIDRNITIVDF